jgi:3-dehydroquinate synthetase
VIKYGLIRDLPFLEWLEASMSGLIARDPRLLAARDRALLPQQGRSGGGGRNREGGRALLNLGHTFGHAIETGMGYGEWLHGEAVAAGTVMAANLVAPSRLAGAADVERVEALLQRAGLPVSGPALGVERYLELMSHDKKVVAGKLRLVLLKALAEAVTHADAPRAEIIAAIASCCNA